MYTFSSANFWLAPDRKTGVGFILDLGETKMVNNVFIVNTKHSARATREFHVYISTNDEGPWIMVLEDSLIDTRRAKTVPSKTEGRIDSIKFQVLSRL